MRLAQKATGLLKGLRPKQSGGRRADGLDKDEAKPLNEKARVEELKRKQASRPPRGLAATAIAPSTRKRCRSMGHPAIAIHEDGYDANTQPRHVRKMAAQLAQDEASEQDESGSDATDSEAEPDESVMEDMKKLEESFEGISHKYRLINRIGEGKTIPKHTLNRSNVSQVPSRRYTRPSSCKDIRTATSKTNPTVVSPKTRLHPSDVSWPLLPKSLNEATSEIASSWLSKRYMSPHHHTASSTS